MAEPVDSEPSNSAYQTQQLEGPPPDPSSLPDFRLGEFGDYELMEEIATGGMGIVYKAMHKRLRRVEALKMIIAGRFASSRDLDRFRFEAEAAAALDHPNIVSVYGVGENNGQPFLTLRWVDGGSLVGRMKSLKEDPQAGCRLIATVARAVHYAHQRGILHRDLKPGNILIDSAGEPHVTDFGLAKRLDAETSMSPTVGAVGTAAYMAPEQARGERALTTAADVYSLGSILYEILVGHPPFPGPNALEVMQRLVSQPVPAPHSLNPGVDRTLEAICLKCLEKDPRRRYATAQAFAEDLERFLRGERVSVQHPGMWDWLRQELRNRPQPSTYTWPILVRCGLILLAMHAGIFIVVQLGLEALKVWAVLLAGWIAFGGVVLRHAASRFRLLHAAERQTSMFAVGHLLTDVLLFLTVFGSAPLLGPADRVLNWYPPLALLSGFGLFILGTTHWGRFYVIGLGMMLLCGPMLWWPHAAPLIYGCAIAVVLLWWANALRVMFGTGLEAGLPSGPYVGPSVRTRLESRG